MSLFSTSGVIFATATDYGNITSGLVGHWKLDETSGNIAYDSTTNAMNGTVGGGLTFTGAQGVVDNCLSGMNFSANKYITVPNNALQNFSSDFSLCAWIKSTGWGSFYKNSTNNFGQYEFSYRGGAYNGIYFRTGGSNDVIPTTNKSDLLYDGNWHHVCATRTGSTIALYIDGAKLTVTGNPAYYSFATNNINLTLRSDGSMDDARMYNRALSDAEVLSLFQYRNKKIFSVG